MNGAARQANGAARSVNGAAAATGDKTRANGAQRRRAAAADPIGLWLDACRSAAALFQYTTDPRKALLLMNPFAPFAAYAAFAQPDFLNGLAKSAGAGLGVWGALPFGGGAFANGTPKNGASMNGATSEAASASARARAAREAQKLYSRALPLASRR